MRFARAAEPGALRVAERTRGVGPPTLGVRFRRLWQALAAGGPSAREQPGRLPYFTFVEDGGEVTFVLDETADRLTIGRGPGIDLRLDGDETVSQLHAELERLGRHWVVSDDGLSRHGSYLNGERLSGRCRLRDGDELRVGRPRSPSASRRRCTAARSPRRPRRRRPRRRLPTLTDRQREVLIALARPFAREGGYSVPGHEPPDRRRDPPQRRRRQAPPADPVRALRDRLAAAEREARPPGRAACCRRG